MIASLTITEPDRGPPVHFDIWRPYNPRLDQDAQQSFPHLLDIARTIAGTGESPMVDA